MDRSEAENLIMPFQFCRRAILGVLMDNLQGCEITLCAQCLFARKHFPFLLPNICFPSST